MKRSMKKMAMMALLAGAGWAMNACSMMETDLSDCPTGLYVSFEYDYNLQRADMFKDQVGSVTVYVFDEEGRFVTQQTTDNRPGQEPLKVYGYQMHFADLPDGHYRLVAFANQRAYDETLEDGANFVRTTLQKGDPMEALQVKLDRTPVVRTTDVEANPRVEHGGLPLDTLWNACNTHLVEVKSTRPTYDTLSMVCDTKMLTLSLRNLDEGKEADIDTRQFEVFIIDNNGWLNHDNSLHADEDIVYTPFHDWMTDYRDGEGNLVQRTAHYGLMFSRLVYHAEDEQNALLIVRNKETGKEVAAINLSDCLAQGRNAVDYYRYTPQEFLDRAGEFSLTFFLKGDTWLYADLTISILSWSKRIQNVQL